MNNNNLKRIIIFFILLISGNTFLYSQNDEIIKLSEIINNKNSDDTTVAIAYLNVVELLYVSNIDTTYDLGIATINVINHALKKNPTPKVKKRLLEVKTETINNIGYYFLINGKSREAIDYYNRAKKISIENNDQKGLANYYLSVGYIYDNNGNVQKALEYYHESLKISEKIQNSLNISIALNNIGSIYNEQNEVEKALQYYRKSLDISKIIDDKQGIAQAYNNIGYIYDNRNELDKAISYYKKSLDIYLEIGDKGGIASAYNNIGIILKKQGNIVEGLNYYKKSLSYYIEGNDKEGVAISYDNIARVQLELGEIQLAEENGLKSFKIASELRFPYIVETSAEVLSSIYEKKGDGMKSLQMYKLYTQMKDSISNEETQKATIRQQTKYEFEKEQIVKENQAKENARIQDEATKRRDNLQYSFIFLGILLLFGIVLSLGFIKVSHNLAEGLIFFAFLILFEFILVFTDPYLQDITNDEPMYNLAANALIALLIFPLHALLERLLKKRIVKD